MAQKIPGLKIERLKNATYYEMMSDVVGCAEHSSGITTYLPGSLAALKTDVQELAAEMGLSQKSPLTQQIAETDEKRDAALVAAKNALRAATENPDPDVKSAAVWLANNTKLLKTRVVPQYDQQTGEVTIAVDELLERQPERTEQAMIKPYIMQLKRLNDQMCQLLIARDTERGAQGKSRVADLRQRIDGEYRTLIEEVNAFVIVFGHGKLVSQPEENPFQTFADFMLGIIDRYKRVIFRETGEKEEEVTEEEEETVTDGDGTTTTEEVEETMTRK